MSDLLQKFALIIGLAIGAAFVVAGHDTMAQSHFMKPESTALTKTMSRS
ncbi:MAG: hypothetical protein JNM81_08380 [Rhodospirillaceae bacterium]|nr:hypothetical protein [Rhodospirillaceae bacterium]